ncbi:MAG: PAS domain S-box protein, partial [Actinomycetota bacterium]|nr:PAS domain S-box protein [Actinomycetota bacterium]
MTIARKLWLGFGTLILILVLASLIIFFSQRAVDDALREIVEVEEPTRAASYEMEINAVEIGQDVLDYLETGDPKYRERFSNNRADFERFKARYDALVDTERGEKQGDRIEVLYEEYAALGEKLTSGEPSGGQGGALLPGERRFLVLQAELDALFDEEVQPWHTGQFKEAEAAAEDAIRGVYLTLVGLLSGGLLASLLAGTFINRSIIGSVLRLREGADRVGRGELDHRIELDTTDELGTVAAAFNDMLDRRREVEMALQESRERFRGLSEASFEGIAIIEGGAVVEANTAFARMFGYEPSEVVGMPATDFIAPEFREEVALRQISSLSEEPYEVAGIKKDGTVFYVEARGRASSYQDRTVLLTAFRDITERKEAEEKIRKAEQRYRNLVERVPAVVYVQEIGSPDAAMYMSPQIEILTGYTPEDCEDPDLRWRMVHPEDRESLRSEDEPVSEPGEVFTNEYRVLHRDGRTVWVRNESVLIEDEASGSRYWQGFMVDITERKRAEQELQKSEALTRAIVETTPNGIITMTKDGLVRSFNPGAEQIFGYAAGEVVGRPLRMLMPERFRGPHEAGFRRYVEGGEAHVVGKGAVELAGLRKDGTEFPLDLSLGEMRAEDDILFTGIVRDITERRRAEENLKESEERYRTLVETVQEGIAFIAPEGGLVNYCNEAYAEILGLTQEEMIGRSFFDFLEAEEREKALRQR